MNSRNKKFLDQNLWPMLIIGSLTALVAFSFAVMKIANRDSSDLVARDYYARGYNLKEIVAAEHATKASGWTVDVVALSPEASGDYLLQINVTDRNQQRCDSISGICWLYRPSEAELDISASELTSIGRGRYLRSLPRELERGHWEAVVELHRGTDRYVNRISFMVP